MAEVLDKIEADQTARGQQKLEAFAVLVKAIVDGSEPDADEVERTLAEAGKTPTDLRAAAERLQRRRELRARLDGLADIDREDRKVKEKIAAAGLKLKEAQERYDEATSPLELKLRELQQQRTEAENARAELRKTAPPELKEQLAKVGNAARRAHAHAIDQRKAADFWLGEVKRIQTEDAAFGAIASRADLLKEIKVAKRRAEQCKENAQAAGVAAQAVLAKEEEITKAMLEP